MANYRPYQIVFLRYGPNAQFAGRNVGLSYRPTCSHTSAGHLRGSANLSGSTRYPAEWVLGGTAYATVVKTYLSVRPDPGGHRRLQRIWGRTATAAGVLLPGGSSGVSNIAARSDVSGPTTSHWGIHAP